MVTIYKYPIETTDRQLIKMPSLSEILCVQLQNGEPCIWARVDISTPMIEKTISVYGTGNPIESGFIGCYIGTYQLHGGALVFHVFDETASTLTQTKSINH